MTTIRTMRAATAIAVAALAVAGCDSGRPSVAAELADVVLSATGEPGFVVDAAATGPMPLRTAAVSTTARPSVLADYLDGAGYRGGFARVLTRDEEFVTALAFELADSRAAQGLVDLVLDQLAGSVAFRPFTDPALPGGRGFTLTSDVAGAVRFCVGEWFAHGARAFAVTRCAPFVLSVPAVTGLALAQHRRAVESGRG